MKRLFKCFALASARAKTHRGSPSVFDGGDGGRYDAHEWLIARDALKALISSSVVVSATPATPAAPAAHWRVDGEPDPHGVRYDCERAELIRGEMTDDQLANEFYMYDHRGGLHSIMWLGAAKDRIRWLSRELVKAHDFSKTLAGMIQPLEKEVIELREKLVKATPIVFAVDSEGGHCD